MSADPYEPGDWSVTPDRADLYDERTVAKVRRFLAGRVTQDVWDDLARLATPEIGSASAEPEPDRADPPALDMERLARALQVWWTTTGSNPGAPDWEARGGWIGEATRIAGAYDEYAALTPPAGNEEVI